ncbi:MAG: hypothetical protein LUG62_08625 [Clostridiales bacterium]|nr:hypothetical protein [Clostridiales bacterium]
MNGNPTYTTENPPDVREKMERILEAADSQYPFSKRNFVALRKFVFLWIVGDAAEELGNLLRTEIRQIVDDERTICIIHSQAGSITGEEILEKFLRGYELVKTNNLAVDSDHIMICPVFLTGCFQDTDEKVFARAALYIQRQMRLRHRYLEWNPFVLTLDWEIRITINQLRGTVCFMDTVMEDGRENFLDCCFPACVISDVNEKGHEVSAEQKAKIIVMLTVFRNTRCENEATVSSTLLPVQKGESDYFFTARAISVCEPVKSLTLNRLLAVHNEFQKGQFSQDRLFDRWEETFFNGKAWREQLDRLPHDEEYNILTAPIASMIPIQDPKKYERELRDFCDKYYYAPLREGEETLLDAWWDSFWESFFLQLAGSIETLNGLEEHREKILEKVPVTRVKGTGLAGPGDLRYACELWLVNELRGKQRELVKKALEPGGSHIARFRRKKTDLADALQDLGNLLRNQITRLSQTELLLNTGGGHVAGSADEAERWFLDYRSTVPQRVRDTYHAYQEELCALFQTGTKGAEGIGIRLLDIYERITAGSIESRENYMKTKLASLASADMEQVIRRLEESWLYPVRRIGAGDQGKAHRLYVMGNTDNYLCRKILEQTSYQVAFKECALDDRLEIVRVSDRFGKEELVLEGTGE